MGEFATSPGDSVGHITPSRCCGGASDSQRGGGVVVGDGEVNASRGGLAGCANPKCGGSIDGQTSIHPIHIILIGGEGQWQLGLSSGDSASGRQTIIVRAVGGGAVAGTGEGDREVVWQCLGELQSGTSASTSPLSHAGCGRVEGHAEVHDIGGFAWAGATQAIAIVAGAGGESHNQISAGVIISSDGHKSLKGNTSRQSHATGCSRATSDGKRHFSGIAEG